MTPRAAPVLAVTSLALLSACGPRYDEATTELVPSPGGTLTKTKHLKVSSTSMGFHD